MTVHDLAVFRHPEAFNRWTRAYSPRVVPRVLAAAQRVIAVSEFTRQELIEMLRVPDEKIRVVPNAVGDEFTHVGEAEEGDYVLAVGTLEPRKNLERLVEAVQRTKRELRVVGARGWGGVEVGGNGVRWLGEVSDTELAAPLSRRGVRRLSVALRGFWDSRARGHGLRRTGRDDARHRDGGGGRRRRGAGRRRDPAEIAAGIERAATDRDELVARGLERASQFRWDAVAAATVQVYREAAA